MKCATVLACLFFLGGELQAQGLYRGSRPRTRHASTEPYESTISQARIRAAAAETLLLYRIAEGRYERISARLAGIAADPQQGKFVGAGGRYELAYKRIEIGAPEISEVATAHTEELKSIVRRATASEIFDTLEADRYLRRAKLDLLLLNLYLNQFERQVRSLDFQTWCLTPNGREPYIRISPNQPPCRHP
jgi:hypothetical protein